MPPTPFRDVVPRLRRLLAPRADAADSDGDLVARFVATRDEAAFAGLVARHGPLVRGVGRRVLGPDAADDAFQATFLVLARRAGSIRRPAAVGSWLYGVAYHLSQQARTRAGRRERYERLAVDRRHEPSGLPDPSHAAALTDLLSVLDAELARLPDRLRAPLLLCYIDGRTQDEAAKQLGWSVGTFRRRLDRARDLLRARMERRGATLSAGLFATLLAADAVTAAVPADLARATTQLAMTFLAGGAVAPPVAALARGGLSMLNFHRLTAAAALAVLLGGLTVGTGVLLGTADDKSAPNVAKTDPPKSDGPPLPAGAVVRLGTARFRHGSDIRAIHVVPDGRTVLTQGSRSIRFWDADTGVDRGGIDLTDEGPEFMTSSLMSDGRMLLTTRRNGTAQVWDLSTRTITRSFLLAEPPFDAEQVTRIVHAPDGSAIAAVTGDGSIRVCDVATGRERPELRSHSDAVGAVAFSPDAQSVLVARKPGDVQVWDVKTGRFVTGHSLEPRVRNLVVSPNGQHVVGSWVGHPQAGAGQPGRGESDSLPQEGLAHFNRTTNVISKLGGHPAAHNVLAITPDSRFLLAPDRTSSSRMLLQWDLTTGRAVRQYMPLAGPISALAFTPDGRTLITADSALYFWDWKTGQPRDRVPDRRAGIDPPFVVSTTGFVASPAEGAAAIIIRDLNTGREVRQLAAVGGQEGKLPLITALAASADGNTLAATGTLALPDDNWQTAEKTIWVWDLPEGKLRHRLNAADTFSQLTLNRDGTRLAAARDYRTGNDQTVAFWDLATGQDWELPGDQSPRGTWAMSFSPDGGTFATFDGSQAFNWSLATGEVSMVGRRANERFGPASGRGRGGFSNPGTGGLRNSSGRVSVATTPDLRRVVDTYSENQRGGGHPDAIRVLDLTTGLIARTIRAPRGTVRRVAISADGRRIAAATDGELPPVMVWDVETGREIRRFTGLRGQATGLAFAPDGKRLIAASSDGTMLVWDVGE